MSIKVDHLKRVVADIKESEKEWVNDSHSESEYQGVCQGLDMLVRHFEELENQNANDN
tara:strand:- start:229 stop:402 length:174 start_codon:yes stop_codon:yes gene_type:complete